MGRSRITDGRGADLGPNRQKKLGLRVSRMLSWIRATSARNITATTWTKSSRALRLGYDHDCPSTRSACGPKGCRAWQSVGDAERTKRYHIFGQGISGRVTSNLKIPKLVEVYRQQVLLG
jgi:hypothetical protein